MKVRAIKLENFMGFADTEWVELRPITLVYGWNSTGKSALIRALLLLRQSLQLEQKAAEPLIFVSDHGVDLGSFWRMIRGRIFYDESPVQAKEKGAEDELTVRRQMVFGFRCEANQEVLAQLSELRIEPRNDDEKYIDLSLSFQFNEQAATNKVELSVVTLEAPFDLDGNKEGRKAILQAEYLELGVWRGWYLSSHFFDDSDLYYPSDEKAAKNPFNTSVVWYTNLEFKAEKGFLPSLYAKREAGTSDRRKDQSLPSESNRGDSYQKIRKLFEHCCDSIKDFFSDEKFRYLGPIRSAPRRTYLLSESSQHKWDASGQTAIRDFLSSYQEEGSVEQDELNAWLHALGIGEKLHVKRLKLHEKQDGALTEAFQLGVEEGSGTMDVNMRDVGYGASQVLPILLQVLAPPEDGLVIIEQPELHLHPEAQAVMADLFINNTNKRTRFLIETHSEHIKLRLQLRIVGGKPRYLASSGQEKQKYKFLVDESFELSGDDFGLVFVTRDQRKGDSELRYIKADPYGRLIGDPAALSSFFGRDFLDSSVFSIEAERKAMAAKPEVEK